MKKPQGMSVSLADIMIAYIVVFGEAMPSDMPFATAGELVRTARHDHWQDLMRACQDERAKHPLGHPYEAIAATVKTGGF